MHTPRTGIRRMVVGLALGSLLALGLGVSPAAQAASGPCVFDGEGRVWDGGQNNWAPIGNGATTSAKPLWYRFKGVLTCADGTQNINGTGHSPAPGFGCFVPGTSTATIKTGHTYGSGTSLGTITFQHAGVSMTSTAASGSIAAAQMAFYTDPVSGGQCASSGGLGGADLAGVFVLS